MSAANLKNSFRCGFCGEGPSRRQHSLEEETTANNVCTVEILFNNYERIRGMFVDATRERSVVEDTTKGFAKHMVEQSA